MGSTLIMSVAVSNSQIVFIDNQASAWCLLNSSRTPVKLADKIKSVAITQGTTLLLDFNGNAFWADGKCSNTF